MDTVTDDIFLDKLQIIENSTVKCCIGLLITLYFEYGDSRDKRTALLECYQDYINRVGLYLHWVGDADTGKPINITKSHLPQVEEWQKTMASEADMSIMAHGGNKNSDASFYTFQGFCRKQGRHRLSFLSVTLPISWVNDNPQGTFVKMTQTYSEKLKAYHGYAGFAALSPLGYSAARTAELEIYALARRFPGLEVDYPISQVRHLEKGIKGVNWLTILNNQWLEKLGSIEFLSSHLDDSFIFHHYTEGMIIQAGPHPQLGDSNRKNIPEHYRIISHLLKKIRIKYPDVLQASA